MSARDVGLIIKWWCKLPFLDYHVIDALLCPCKKAWSKIWSFRSSSEDQRVDWREEEPWAACWRIKSWRPAGCCTRGTAAWWRQGCACMSVLSGSPGWSGQRWGGLGVQARWWVVGWCGWHTCRKGFQKTAPSWTLASKIPKQLPLHRDSPWELSWHKRGTHSRILKEPRHQRSGQSRTSGQKTWG